MKMIKNINSTKMSRCSKVSVGVFFKGFDTTISLFTSLTPLTSFAYAVVNSSANGVPIAKGESEVWIHPLITDG
jgi:hypothetical protein